MGGGEIHMRKLENVIKFWSEIVRTREHLGDVGLLLTLILQFILRYIFETD